MRAADRFFRLTLRRFMLGFDVSERTVSRLMPPRPPDPEARQRWRNFLRNHREVPAAMDFFNVPTATSRVLDVFFVIHHAGRTLLHVRVTDHPTDTLTRSTGPTSSP
jgi:putative transposase